MDISLSPATIAKAFSHFLHRYHVVLFSVFALGGLAVAVFLLNNTLIAAANTTPSTATGVDFDQGTLQKVKTMHTSEQVTSETADTSGLKLDQPRINPLSSQ